MRYLLATTAPTLGKPGLSDVAIKEGLRSSRGGG
jgi:hypothetical protein